MTVVLNEKLIDILKAGNAHKEAAGPLQLWLHEQFVIGAGYTHS